VANEPAAQLVQVDAAGTETLPAAHVVHETELAEAKRPAAHFEQPLAPARAAKRPATQLVQLVAAAKEPDWTAQRRAMPCLAQATTMRRTYRAETGVENAAVDRMKVKPPSTSNQFLPSELTCTVNFVTRWSFDGPWATAPVTSMTLPRSI